MKKNKNLNGELNHNDYMNLLLSHGFYEHLKLDNTHSVFSSLVDHFFIKPNNHIDLIRSVSLYTSLLPMFPPIYEVISIRIDIEESESLYILHITDEQMKSFLVWIKHCDFLYDKTSDILKGSK